MILLIDNYDSFTYNLAHLFGALGVEVTVLRNDEIDADEAERLAPSHLVVSPGPGRPADAGVSVEIVRRLGADDADARRLPRATRRSSRRSAARSATRASCVHGKASPVRHDGTGIFTGPAAAVRRGAVPLARRDPAARRPRADRVCRRRRGDGGAPSHAAGRRRAVPSRVGAHAGGTDSRTQLPRGAAVIQASLGRLLDGHDLTRDEARETMNEIMRGEATQAQIAGFLVALRAKGETADEIAGLRGGDARARAARAAAARRPRRHRRHRR